MIETANARKEDGDTAFLTSDAPDGYTLHVPNAVVLRRDEIISCLGKLNEAKEHGHADVLFTFHHGEIVKRHVNLKDDGPGRGRLYIGGTPGPKQF